MLGMMTGRQGTNPSTDFLVGRVRRTFRGQSTVGALLTSRTSASPDDNRLYGVDTFLRFFDNLEVSSYLMMTDTTSRKGHDQARRLGVAWREDDWTIAGQYEEVQPNFNPEVGFVRRLDMGHYETDLSWRPRPHNSRRIRNYTLGTTADFYAASSTGDLQTRQQSVNTGLSFQSGATLGATVLNSFDRLVVPFAIYPGVIIPVGDYQYANMVLNYTSDQLGVVKDNLSAANSRIKDVDVAEESTQYARYNILVQAGTAMLAQANAAPQSALRLLQ